MGARRTDIILVMLACLAPLTLATPVPAGASEKETVLKSCARLFGAPADERQHLFEVNQAFVLQAEFDKRGKLQRLAVKPKYFFGETHPEWAEPRRFPTLSHDEFKDLLMKLEGIKSKGDMVRPRNESSFVTNLTAYFKETYRRAVLEWGELADRSGVRFFSVTYLKSKS